MRIRNAFEEIFCLRSNLSRTQPAETGKSSSGFGEPGGTPPPRIFRSTPREMSLSLTFAACQHPFLRLTFGKNLFSFLLDPYAHTQKLRAPPSTHCVPVSL